MSLIMCNYKPKLECYYYKPEQCKTCEIYLEWLKNTKTGGKIFNPATDSITSLNARRIAEKLNPDERYQGGLINTGSVRPCKNSNRHVSAYPGFGRVVCPDCMGSYISK